MAQCGLQSTVGESAEVAVVAVRLKAAGEIAFDPNLFIPFSAQQRCRCRLLIDAEISYGRSRTNLGIPGWSGDEIDRTSNRVGTIERRSRSSKHFDSFERRRGDGLV